MIGRSCHVCYCVNAVNAIAEREPAAGLMTSHGL